MKQKECWRRIVDELKTKHWDHVHNWVEIEKRIDTVAKCLGCSVETLREVMRHIEKAYPKPIRKKRKAWRNVEYKKPCRTCGTVIGFARTDKGNMMPVDLNDFSTHWGCEKPGKRKKQR